MRFIGIAGILLSVFMMVKPFDHRNNDCGSAIFPEWSYPSAITYTPRDPDSPIQKALDRAREIAPVRSKASVEPPRKARSKWMTCEDEINERRVIYGVVGIFGLGVFFFGGNLINTGRVTGVKEDEDKQQ